MAKIFKGRAPLQLCILYFPAFLLKSDNFNKRIGTMKSFCQKDIYLLVWTQ